MLMEKQLPGDPVLSPHGPPLLPLGGLCWGRRQLLKFVFLGEDHYTICRGPEWVGRISWPCLEWCPWPFPPTQGRTDLGPPSSPHPGSQGHPRSFQGGCCSRLLGESACVSSQAVPRPGTRVWRKGRVRAITWGRGPGLHDVEHDDKNDGHGHDEDGGHGNDQGSGQVSLA